MPYMLLIVEPQGQRRLRSPEESRAVYEQMLAYSAGLKARGVLLESNSLRAESVRLDMRSEEHTSELQSQSNLVCRLLLEKKKKKVWIADGGHAAWIDGGPAIED